MKWNWDPNHWKRSTKVLLGLATIWPVIYMGLFFAVIVLVMALSTFAERTGSNSEDIDLIQLERKIQNGEIKQLTLRPREIIAIDRIGDREYHTTVTNKATRDEILAEASKVTAGQPRVPRIDEETGQSPVSRLFPAGIVALLGAHFFTILLIMALMPLYIVLAVKSERVDQTLKIVWAVVICMMGMFAMPVYWYLYIWRTPSSNPGGSVAQSPGDSTSVSFS